MKKLIAVAVGVAVAFSATVASAATYTRDLTIGSSGADVSSLQATLVSKGKLVMPAGVSMGYFGSLTKTALASYQASAGIAPAVGYFGPITRAHFNAMTDEDMGGDDDNGDDDNGGDLQGGEGDVKDFDILGNPGNEDVNEGETKKVLGFEFEAQDSDLRLERLEIIASSTSDDPWDFFDSAVLYRGDDEIASIDGLDDEDEWNEEINNQAYTFRFDNIDEVVDEDDTAKFYVEVTAQDNLDSGDVPSDFYVAVANDGLRVVDAEGIDIYEGDADDDRTVTFEGPDAGDIDFSLDDEDNEDRTAFVDEDSDTDGVEIMRFTIEANASDNQLQELVVSIASTTNENGGATVSEVIKSLTLEVDGDEVGSEDMTSGAATSTATFEDLEVDIAEDEEIEVVVYADIESQQDNYMDGFEFHASVATTSVVIEDAEGDEVDFGTQSTLFGGNIELRVDGMSVEFVSGTVANVFSADDANESDKKTFNLKFEVTASGDDVYLDRSTQQTLSPSGSAAGIAWATTSDSDMASTSAVSSVLSNVDGSTGGDTTDSYKVTKDSTRTFNLAITVTAGDEGYLGAMLTGINWDTDSSVGTDYYTQHLDDFKVSPVFFTKNN